jgi:class 3 adenylate cyclase
MMALLFADVVGYSQFSEEEVPLFFEHVLKPVGQMCAGAGCAPPVQGNTWGDGLYFVFRQADDAGVFALRLRDHFAQTDWAALGFRRRLSLRTGLHFGPVYKIRNPVTGREDYTGTHVSRAARIEPITPPNEVYASEGFAAIAFADRVTAFTCDYVGQVGLHKDYGTYPTYHVRRR